MNHANTNETYAQFQQYQQFKQLTISPAPAAGISIGRRRWNE
jgi:hypothetical protein